MIPSAETVAVIGAGAVGSVLAGCLIRCGERVLLVESDPQRREQLEADGVRVEGRFSVSGRPAELLGSIEELVDRKPRAVLLCTKAWSLRSILPRLSDVIAPKTLVASLQNGLGSAEEIAQRVAPEQIARGVINFAGSVDRGSGRVLLSWFNAPNFVGPWAGAANGGPSSSLAAGRHARSAASSSRRAGQLADNARRREIERLAEQLARAGLETRALDAAAIRRQAFLKTVLSAALGALCACSRLTMGQAMRLRHTRRLAVSLLEEGLAVASASGHDFSAVGVEGCLRYLEAGGDHRPSMWTDLQRGNLTEIEYINGRLVEIGRALGGLPVEVNAVLTALVVTEEIGSGARRPEDLPPYLVGYEPAAVSELLGRPFPSVASAAAAMLAPAFRQRQRG